MSEQKIYPNLDALPDAGVPYELVLIEDIGQIYTYTEEEGWEPVDTSSISLGGLQQYEMNKLVISQLPLLSKEQIAEGQSLLEEYFNNNPKTKYFMMLNHDIRSYTVFVRSPIMQETLAEGVISIGEQYGKIWSINYNSDKTAVEIWLKRNDSPIMFLLFDYDWGIVQCR